MVDLLDPLESSRQFTFERIVALSDTDPTGRLRLDACARYLQDVAAFDAIDANIGHFGNWVLRHNEVHIAQFPIYGQKITSTTYLTGSGRAWIERTSKLIDTNSARELVGARALWVLTGAETKSPITIPKELFEKYGPLATHHKVSVRDGRRPELPPTTSILDWKTRFSDQDILRHLNNAVYLEPVEEILHLHKIELPSRSRATLDATYRESTTIDDPSDIHYSIVEVAGRVEVAVYFAKGTHIRAQLLFQTNQ